MGISAGIGIANFPFDDGAGFWEWVDLCDQGGVDSIWQSDRLLGPGDNLECMTVMAALSGRTRRMKFGMNVASLGLRDPVLMAKACASIDLLSGGRLLPAFGVGSAQGQDYRASGIPTKGRGQRTAEGLEILTRLWSEDAVTFEGKHFQLDQATIAPKPLQQPMPLWVGGSAAQAIQRTARFGTGWQAGLETPDEVGPVISAIKAALPGHGRQIADDHYGAGFGFRFGAKDDPVAKAHRDGLAKRIKKDPSGLLATGGVDEIMALLLQFRAVGVHKFILRPMAQGTGDMLAQTRLMVEQVLPEVARLNPAKQAAQQPAQASS